MKRRLQRDPYFFALMLTFLAFLTVCLAITWRLFGTPLLLALTVASLLPAFWLFYLREQAAQETKQDQRRHS